MTSYFSNLSWKGCQYRNVGSLSLQYSEFLFFYQLRFIGGFVWLGDLWGKASKFSPKICKTTNFWTKPLDFTCFDKTFEDFPEISI